MFVEQVKRFKTYSDQVELLRQRGMRVSDPEHAEAVLARLNYYRLSGYWYPMRRFSPGDGIAQDEFVDGASFRLVEDLYTFDERLRHCVFSELDRVELAIRAKLGYELGRIDPLVYLHPEKLNDKRVRRDYKAWLNRYQLALKKSKEDFVVHHKTKYGENLPIWAAVEIMDWGMLSMLYGMSPDRERERIAQPCGLNGPQLYSWLRSLNVLRNYAAHHARMFNRVYSRKPKLNDDVRLAPIAETMNRAFGQLSLIQYLHRQLDLSPADRLPKLFDTYPHNPIVPFSRTGAPDNWRELTLWRI